MFLLAMGARLVALHAPGKSPSTGFLAGDGGRQGLLWRVSVLDQILRWDHRQHRQCSCLSGFRHSQFPEVLWLSNNDKPAWVVSQPVALDMQQMGRPASASTWSVTDGRDPRRPAGYETEVTARKVSKLWQEGQLTEAVEALGALVQRDCRVSLSLFYRFLRKCMVQKDLALGRRIHALAVRNGYGSDTFLCHHILRMYASHARLQEAMEVFTVVAKPDSFMWASIISAHVKHKQAKQAIELYHQMRRSSVKPDRPVFLAALQACARGADLTSGQQVHADVLASGDHHLFVWNCLVDMYAKCGSLEDAQRVFDGLAQKDVVTWNALIAGYAQQGMGQEALRLYRAMQEEGAVEPTSVTYLCLLQACASLGSPALEKGKQLHAQIGERGLQGDAFVANSLVNMYAKCGSLEDAQGVFDGLVQKDVVTWNAMIAGYSQQGMGQEALHIHSTMQQEGIAAPDSVTFVCLLQACASLGNQAFKQGKQLHAQVRDGGLQADVFIASSLINMYAKCGSLQDARDVFDRLGQKNVVTWNAMISGYSQQGMGQEALALYRSMQEDSIVAPNAGTFVCILQGCASLGTAALETGKQLHAQIREQGLESDVLLASSLVNMYAKCGSVEDARGMFDGLGQKNVVMWNTMIAGYAQQGMGPEALALYRAMQQEGLVAPDGVTFVSVLQACATAGSPALEEGKQLHANIGEGGVQADVFVANSLVNMYAKCGSLEDARRVFDGLVQKNVVTWNAIIAGYSQQGMGQEALGLYRAMQEEGISVPSSVTFVCLLQACANVAALHVGRQLHAQIKEQGLQADVLVACSLINMYGKSGNMAEAQQVFEALPHRDDVAWDALIAGYTRQGESQLVFDLFHRMTQDGVQPVGITFLSVLTVCSHAGLVDKGQEYFEVMRKHYGITPTVEHYTCMVDLLGRAGRLHESLTLVRTMPVQPNAAVWHTLLGACRKWSNVEVGRHVFDEAVKLDKKDAAAYVLMSNIYTDALMREEAQEMQARRIGSGAWKQPGQSWWTDMDGLVHTFLVGDKKHPDSERIYATLKQLEVYLCGNNVIRGLSQPLSAGKWPNCLTHAALPYTFLT